MPIWTACAKWSVGWADIDEKALRFGMSAPLSISMRRLKSWLLACPLSRRRWACVLHLGLIAVLSLLPAWLFPPSIAQIPGVDKWVHVAMYGVLGGLMRWAAGQEDIPPAARGLPMVGAAYGLLMEFLQSWVGGAGRTFSWGDAAANLVGVFAFWWAAGRVLGRGHKTTTE